MYCKIIANAVRIRHDLNDKMFGPKYKEPEDLVKSIRELILKNYPLHAIFVDKSKILEGNKIE